MSSHVYPNSATRKMYGEAGRRIANQKKQFSSILTKERTESRTNFHKQLKAKEEELTIEIMGLETSLRVWKYVALGGWVVSVALAWYLLA